MKEKYVTPLMECMQIEAEGTFAGSIVTKEKSDVKAAPQEYHEFDASGQWEDEKGVVHKNVTWE